MGRLASLRSFAESKLDAPAATYLSAPLFELETAFVHADEELE
jgi:hypothetical protein